MQKGASARIVKAIEGKLEGMWEQVRQARAALKREIDKKERELATLRRQHQRAGRLLQAPAKTGRRRGARVGRRAPRTRWQKILKSLPRSFTAETLASSRRLAKRPKAQLYAAITRWKKAGLVKTIGKGRYERVEKAAGAKKAVRRKPKAAPPVKSRAKREAAPASAR